MNRALFLILIIVPLQTMACEEISGTYKSVSETHWNFVLEVQGDNAKLTYTDYWYGERDTRTDQTVESSGYCEKSTNGYVLTFAQQSIEIKYHKRLSHASYGADGSSPGVTGEFISGQTVELWVSK